uniref:Uncharacterized protein n=1 Tax=Cacopsylla melanoneura TaxID=428564 RepID=A0A8D8QRL0_9HEMI
MYIAILLLLISLHTGCPIDIGPSNVSFIIFFPSPILSQTLSSFFMKFSFSFILYPLQIFLHSFFPNFKVFLFIKSLISIMILPKILHSFAVVFRSFLCLFR